MGRGVTAAIVAAFAILLPTAAPAPSAGVAEMHVTIGEPAPNALVGRRFAIHGHTIANGEIRVTAGPRRGAIGQFSADTMADPHGNFHVNVVLRTLRGQQAVYVRISATDPVTSRNTATTLALRLSH